jgi:hypothetical protein
MLVIVMNDETRSRGDRDESAQDDGADREAILARRQRFTRAALTALAMGATIAATASCAPCLEVVSPDGATDAGDASPMACLAARPDDASGPDATPMPCLGALPDDAGTDSGNG